MSNFEIKSTYFASSLMKDTQDNQFEVNLFGNNQDSLLRFSENLRVLTLQGYSEAVDFPQNQEALQLEENPVELEEVGSDAIGIDLNLLATSSSNNLKGITFDFEILLETQVVALLPTIQPKPEAAKPSTSILKNRFDERAVGDEGLIVPTDDRMRYCRCSVANLGGADIVAYIRGGYQDGSKPYSFSFDDPLRPGDDVRTISKKSDSSIRFELIISKTRRIPTIVEVTGSINI